MRWHDLAGGPSAGLVFARPDGKPFGRSYVAGWEDKRERHGGDEVSVTPGLRTRAGVQRPVRFHDLRHTCASHLVMGSWGEPWSLEAVREFLGHGSIAVTQRYAHLCPAALSAKAARTTGGGGQSGPALAVSWPRRCSGSQTPTRST